MLQRGSKQNKVVRQQKGRDKPGARQGQARSKAGACWGKRPKRGSNEVQKQPKAPVAQPTMHAKQCKRISQAALKKNYSKNGCVLLKKIDWLAGCCFGCCCCCRLRLALKGLEKKHAKRNLNSRIDTTPLQRFPQWQGDSQAKLMRLAYLTV